MTVPTLTYFNGRGKAEIIRLILTYLKIEFKDERLTAGVPEELRARLPYAQVPLYQDGEITLAQSAAISRYIANKHNFAGANAVEKALVDAVVDSVADVIAPFRAATDDAAKLKYKNETLPKFVGRWEANLKANGGQYFVGSGYTWGDLCIYYGLFFLHSSGLAEELKQFPTLSAFYTAIESIPQIAAYLQARPVTAF
ncbi:hypothetical protein SAMD00019534_071160 [Acytostelium subglobosum LB1]|uniref:hypothetical protein n=1 Tax=Acytostelium subglobosum LB1 TaxID=1410327 RepID=UPI0006447CBE|nr:hypothetical protein SAMD00019534_071160 [Acytostelium subglobosum LB1]GAM23941.1 hypothetical protein SAMD00019534_071160 [Acytostelium subglobosum LB1]|eukprot:XP_012752977.1 hypothetical protein SAMD00019534_071160 [Acytostelium subglobosum LB1]